MKNHIEKYLDVYAEKGPWTLTANALDGIDHAVVIPALAEYPHLLETLHSLSLNSPDELKKTLVVCVVNNRAFPFAEAEDIANNRQTLSLLDSLIKGANVEMSDEIHHQWFRHIVHSPMRLAYVDASSTGLELPEKAGVGLARKIGMDLSLSVMTGKKDEANLLFSLDADTLVETNYLLQARRHFSRRNQLAAVVPFAHRKSKDGAVQDAIATYEAYLRYYVVGLRHARSPYAFHTIGSTIVSTARAYAMVRGMPKRLAGEDFYFLNKLAKLHPIGLIEGTAVYPSPRHSSRTPFGTGKKVGQLVAEADEDYLFYHPEIFTIIRNWFILIERNPHQEGLEILRKAEDIDPALQMYLNEIGFVQTWDKLKKNFPLKTNLLKQFHAWFDGLATLRLVHYLTDCRYPKTTAGSAVGIMQAKISGEKTEAFSIAKTRAAEILEMIKTMEQAVQETVKQEISP